MRTRGTNKGAGDSAIRSISQVVADLVVPETIEVRMAGKDWPIVMSPHVLMLAEKATGLNLMLGLPELIAKPTMQFVCAILYASMKVSGGELSLEEVSDLVNFKNLPKVAQAISLAGAKVLKDLVENFREDQGTENPPQAVA